MKKKLFLILIAFWIFSSLAGEQIIKVGAYENSPKIFADPNGKISGFWADITHHIAEQEDWKIHWMHGSWQECLDRLQNREINLMVDVGFTPERAELFEFSQETVHLSWTRIYKQSGSGIQSILDLEGKIIAGLQGSFDLNGPEGLKAVTNKFEIDCEIREFASYDLVFIELQNAKIDAGIVDKDFGNINESKFNIERTPIVLQPARMQYAFPKDGERTELLMNNIDRHLRKMKEEKNSLYYRAVDRYFTGGEEVEVFPLWLLIILIVLLVTSLLFLFMNRYLNRQVSIRTQKLQADIIERKKVEKALTASEEKYKLLIENQVDLLVKFDTEGRFLFASPSYCSTFDKAEEELIGKKFLPQIHPDDIGKSNEIMNSLYQPPYTCYLEQRIKTRNGWRWFAWIDKAILDEEGEIAEIIGLGRDITEQKNAEEKNLQLAEIIRNSKEGIILSDPAGHIQYVNKAFEEMSGYSQKEIINLDPVDFVVTADPQAMGQEIRSTVKKSGSWQGEMVCKRKDGTSYIIETEVFGITNESGELKSIATIQNDISRRKALEKELEAHRRDLGRLVKERTAELEEKNKKLEEFNRLFIDREFRIKDLRDKLKILEVSLKKD